MRISDWSSDVCSSDLIARGIAQNGVSIDDGPDWAWTASAVPACETAKPNAIAATMNVARHRTWKLMCLMTGSWMVCESGYGDRKSVVEGKSGSVRVDLGGRSIMKKKKRNRTERHTRK